MSGLKEPEKEKIEDLLESIHCEGIPHLTTSQVQEAYQQLQRLMIHWFRVEPQHLGKRR